MVDNNKKNVNGPLTRLPAAAASQSSLPRAPPPPARPAFACATRAATHLVELGVEHTVRDKLALLADGHRRHDVQAMAEVPEYRWPTQHRCLTTVRRGDWVGDTSTQPIKVRIFSVGFCRRENAERRKAAGTCDMESSE